MENWGLVIYGESTLMWDPQEHYITQKRRVTQIIGHEVAHMVCIKQIHIHEISCTC